VSLGTVYRNLELLSRSGIIRKLEIGGHQKRFDGDLGAHQHVRCIRCGRIEDVAGEPSPTECDRNALKEMGYELVDRRVEFLGICPRCRAGEDGGGSGGI
jgi:Fur family ferric uptake transcriptional regulator